MAAAAAAAATMAKRFSTTVLRHPPYRKIQTRPGYGLAAPPKEAKIEDVLKAVNRLETTLKPSEPGRYNDHEKRIAKLESLVYVGGILLSVAVGITVGQPIYIHMIETKQNVMDARMASVEYQLDISPVPPFPATRAASSTRAGR